MRAGAREQFAAHAARAGGKGATDEAHRATPDGFSRRQVPVEEWVRILAAELTGLAERNAAARAAALRCSSGRPRGPPPVPAGNGQA